MVGIEPFQEWRCGGDCNVASAGAENCSRRGAVMVPRSRYEVLARICPAMGAVLARAPQVMCILEATTSAPDRFHLYHQNCSTFTTLWPVRLGPPPR
jgi:hypothetical protein